MLNHLIVLLKFECLNNFLKPVKTSKNTQNILRISLIKYYIIRKSRHIKKLNILDNSVYYIIFAYYI